MDSSTASIQRQRTHLLYSAVKKLSVDSIELVDTSSVGCSKLVAVDSAESKIIVQGLATDWGVAKTGVALRTRDISWIKFDLPEK